jgi:hypothetical protein
VLTTRRADYEALAVRLAQPAGGQVLVIPAGHEPHLREIYTAGVLMDAARARQFPGATSRCHSNVAARFALGQCAFATRYALNDGIWRQHSWGVTDDGEILETTAPREAYFGIVLDRPRAQMMRTEWLGRQQPRHATISVAHLRDQLYDAITDLLHAHRGDGQAVLGEMAAALNTAQGYYATDFDDDFRVFDVSDPDELCDPGRQDADRLVALSGGAHQLLCGLVQPCDVVGRVGEHADDGVWEELREAFPLAEYASGPDVVRVLVASPIKRESAARERVIDDVTEHPAIAEAIVTQTTKTTDGWAFTIAVRPADDATAQEIAEAFTVVVAEA